jgi:two-component system, chemotaxis family, response regulator Rcp1
MIPLNSIDILLIEDNLGDIRWVREAFKKGKLPTNIYVAEDGQAGLDYLHKTHEFEKAVTPDLVLLDLNLPKKDGRVVLKEIKENPRLKQIPVIILTTSSTPQDISRSYENYASGYITKPVGFDQMMQVVSAVEDFWFNIVKLPPKL